MHGNLQGNEARILPDDSLYIECLMSISQNLTLPGEDKILDTLRLRYQEFKNRTMALDSLFASENTGERSIWFNTLYRPVYESFTKEANNLGTINQNTISNNSYKLKDNFYRMIIPLIVAIAVGLLLIILFNYFINYYFISPILKIIQGLKKYSEDKQPYDVKTDTHDEIYELNKEIKSLISHIKKKESAGVFNFNK
jgi:methyl-accepting chemotaxis protein